MDYTAIFNIASSVANYSNSNSSSSTASSTASDSSLMGSLFNQNTVTSWMSVIDSACSLFSV